ncbi:uncharacterized protein LOC129944689 [Eupeodes corollae]|uniref:uncharacterized protein LOC129944689 n=1 Tax=Eupeodes corollae TaxID=290404 RepID=UPI002493744B|nr:uncharacterized protein LOC129944689 [Eupeodes corollae]
MVFGYLSISTSMPANGGSKAAANLADISNQLKRDLSLSYAATDIGSKDGTRAKTITVIKNVAGKKDEPIKVDPKLHKNENWGSEFRDNFDSYGAIPDVPDIDELFEFVNKKKDDKKPKEKDNPAGKEPEGKEVKPKKDKEEPKEKGNEETTLAPAPVEEVTEETTDGKVEKIAGDAELIQPAGKQGKVKSQSLDLGKYSVRETVNDDNNYQNLQNSGRQHFSNSGKTNDKYIQQSVVGYNYPEPNLKGYPSANGYSQQAAQAGRGSITVTTPSGKSYDVPFENSTSNPPYLAPNFRRNQNLQPPTQQYPTSSQRPYVAPNLRKPYEVQLNNTSPPARDCAPNIANNNRQPPIYNVYRNVASNIRPDAFGGYKPRSRGLRY